jgi:hypothetical protein
MKGIDATKKPDGISLFKTLIDLYTKQEGVKIKYELTERHKPRKEKDNETERDFQKGRVIRKAVLCAET